MFVPSKSNTCSLGYEPTHNVEHHEVLHTYGLLLYLNSYILSQKLLPRANALAYFVAASLTKKKKVLKYCYWALIQKPVSSSLTVFQNKLECLHLASLHDSAKIEINGGAYLGGSPYIYWVSSFQGQML